MDFNLSVVRPVSINNQIVIGRREQTVDDIKKWFEKSEDTRADNVRVVSLLDKYQGRTIGEIVGDAEFETSDLPMFLYEFRPAAQEEEEKEQVLL